MSNQHEKGYNSAATKVLFSGILFGTAGTAVTFAPDGATSAMLGFFRLVFGALAFFVLIPKFDGSWKHTFSLINRPVVWFMGIGSAAFQPCFFGATARNGVALSTLITVGSIPVFAGIVGKFLLHEPIKPSWVIFTGIGITGLIIRSWGEIDINDPVGIFLSLGAAASVACYMNAIKIGLNKGGHPYELPTIAYILGALLLTPTIISPVMKNGLSESLGWLFSIHGIAIALFMGIVTMAAPNWLQISSMKYLSPGPIATLSLADPLTATLLGVFVLKEDFSISAGFGLLLVAIAIIGQSWAARNQKTLLL